MVNDSLSQPPLRIERINDVNNPNAKGTGTPCQIVYIEVGHGTTDDAPSFVVNRIMGQSYIEVRKIY
jgi:hypothetical protein